MSMAGDLVLITTDPTSGQSLLGSTETDPVPGGALRGGGGAEAGAAPRGLDGPDRYAGA
ncbi:hypothetical protein [Nocardioides sp. SLBN-35]|uniref:hypothetical protein n=1 Tax=Nocardioides sp. SLBN-35 TaxID=2768445 RepID=UPI00135C84C8|nr:hypothetical protein [Nocardioides sp. SLBN-35]